MSTPRDVDLAWFPLVPRPRPPGLPLEARVAELDHPGRQRGTGNSPGTRRPARPRSSTRPPSSPPTAASPTWPASCAAASTSYSPSPAPLPGWAVRLALQPVLNIPRQLIRDGHGDDAHAMLEALHQAALSRAVAVIDGMRIDFGTLTSTADGHKEACTLTWTALLADGTRALAQAGRWTEAAEHAAAHRGTGARLLDGRQAAILALLADGQRRTRPRRWSSSRPSPNPGSTPSRQCSASCASAPPGTDHTVITTMIAAAVELAQAPDLTTVLTRIRIGLTALDVARASDDLLGNSLRTELIAIATSDAYAAREILAHPQIRHTLTTGQRENLDGIVGACGLGARTIGSGRHERLMAAAAAAETVLAGG